MSQLCQGVETQPWIEDTGLVLSPLCGMSTPFKFLSKTLQINAKKHRIPYSWDEGYFHILLFLLVFSVLWDHLLQSNKSLHPGSDSKCVPGFPFSLTPWLFLLPPFAL